LMLSLSIRLTTCSYAQWARIPKSLIGIGVVHNFQTESQGIDIRFKKFIAPDIAVTPRFSYFFPGNPINEYYAGLDVNYQLNKYRKFQPYFLVGGFYNNWINYEQYGAPLRKKNNLVADLGCGAVFNIGCRLKPYVEWRYNTKWKEGSLGAGLFISFAKCPGRGLASKCPAYH
jgi:hypothetical protein